MLSVFVITTITCAIWVLLILLFVIAIEKLNTLLLLWMVAKSCTSWWETSHYPNSIIHSWKQSSSKDCDLWISFYIWKPFFYHHSFYIPYVYICIYIYTHTYTYTYNIDLYIWGQDSSLCSNNLMVEKRTRKIHWKCCLNRHKWWFNVSRFMEFNRHSMVKPPSWLFQCPFRLRCPWLHEMRPRLPMPPMPRTEAADHGFELRDFQVLIVLGAALIVFLRPWAMIPAGWWFQHGKDKSQLGVLFPTQWKVIKLEWWLLLIPSGKRLHSYGKWPIYSEFSH